MCGIWAYISQSDIHNYYEYFNKISHRGPDASIYMKYKEATVGFHRLAIINKSLEGMQPFVDNNIIFICNGEIYNYKELAYKNNIQCVNDCMCILELFKKLSFEDFINVIKNEVVGEFAFVIMTFENEKINKIINDVFILFLLFTFNNYF